MHIIYIIDIRYMYIYILCMHTRTYIFVFIHIISEWAADLMSYFGNFGGNCVYVGNYVGNQAGNYALILFHDFSFEFKSFTVQWCSHIRTERRGPRNQTPQNCSLNSAVRLEIPGVAQRSQTKLCSHLHTRSARWKILFFFLFLTFLLFLSSTDFSLGSFRSWPLSLSVLFFELFFSFLPLPGRSSSAPSLRCFATISFGLAGSFAKSNLHMFWQCFCTVLRSTPSSVTMKKLLTMTMAAMASASEQSFWTSVSTSFLTTGYHHLPAGEWHCSIGSSQASEGEPNTMVLKHLLAPAAGTA